MQAIEGKTLYRVERKKGFGMERIIHSAINIYNLSKKMYK